MAPEVEARIVALRSEHPGWGPRTLLHYLGREGHRPPGVARLEWQSSTTAPAV
jgi:hypothetical protein